MSDHVSNKPLLSTTTTTVHIQFGTSVLDDGDELVRIVLCRRYTANVLSEILLVQLVDRRRRIGRILIFDHSDNTQRRKQQPTLTKQGAEQHGHARSDAMIVYGFYGLMVVVFCEKRKIEENWRKIHTERTVRGEKSIVKTAVKKCAMGFTLYYISSSGGTLTPKELELKSDWNCSEALNRDSVSVVINTSKSFWI